MLIIALTGNIGSGKSLAAHYFAELGVPIIDADVIAKALVTKGTPALKKIIAHFGQQLLDQQGELKRTQLREIIFQDKAQRLWLENLLHPLVRSRILKEIKRLKATSVPYCIVAIPLLPTPATLATLPIQRVLMIDAPKKIRSTRIQQRDHMSLAMVNAIFSNQASRADYLKVANDVIKNNGPIQQLKAAVVKIHEFYSKKT